MSAETTQKYGQKHAIKCRCFLPQFKNSNIFHSFIVFSEVHDDKVIEKVVKCNNCSTIHKVYDICKSSIINSDKDIVEQTEDDLYFDIPKKMVDSLKRYKADIPTIEHVNFVLQNELWGTIVTISSEYSDGFSIGVYIEILGKNLFKIQNYTNKEII
jgi:hypothetical protein